MEKKDKIIRILRIVMPIVALLSVIIIAPIDLLPPVLAPLPDTVQQQVEETIDLGIDGIIVYVDEAGESPQFYSAGLKNKITHEPADPSSLFKIGSIHKLYIATATAKLISAGTLSAEDTLAKLLPEMDGRIQFADQITLRMLVQHRSGIPNYTDNPQWDWFKKTPSEESILDLIIDQPAMFDPDTKYSYSNSNYFLLGRILDQALGYSHEEYIYNEILAPLDLNHTFFSIDEVEYDDVMSGYWYEYNDDLRFLGGSMVATAQDVGIFLRALNDGSLLNDDEQTIYSDLYEYEHTGWVPGYYSIARYYPDIDTVVVQFVSTTGGDTWGVAEIVGGKTTAISNIIYNRIVRILNQ